MIQELFFFGHLHSMDIYREYENDSEYKDQRRGVVGMKFVKKILLVLVCALSLEGCGFTGNNV